MADLLAGSQADRLHQRRWWALAVVAGAQLMIVLDMAVVFVALPTIQSSLRVSTAERQWVVAAYAITFGGFLLLGGRLVDYFGRRRMFLIALLGFAAASALGGVATGAGSLFAARALQGAFAAVIAPAVLSLISVTFREPAERARAFGVYGMVSGGGAAIGLILGGALTAYASWRWCLLINVPLALVVAAGALAVMPSDVVARRAGYDVAGALSATAGLTCLAQGFTVAGVDGWLSWPTIAFLVAAVVLLTVFVLVEARSRQPVLPLPVITYLPRGLLYLAALAANAAQLSMFLFLTYYFQSVLGYSAIRTGLAFLPFALAVIVTGNLMSTRLLVGVGPTPIMLTGASLGVVGLLALTRLSARPDYVVNLLIPEVVIGLAVALTLFPLNSLVLRDVRAADVGVASAMVSTVQQIGGALGTALLNTVFAGLVAAFVVAHPGATQAAALHGYRWVFAWESGLFLVALVLILVVHLHLRRSERA